MDDDLWLKLPGMHMHISERRLLRSLAEMACRSFESPVFVNIGIAARYGCCSMACLRAGCSRAELIGIDIEEQGKPPSYLGENTTFIIADSSSVKLDTPIHVLFVDGDHTYDGVMADIQNWVNRVVKGGYIAFHDYGHYGKRGFEHVYGVKLAVDEWMRSSGSKMQANDVESIRWFAV